MKLAQDAQGNYEKLDPEWAVKQIEKLREQVGHRDCRITAQQQIIDELRTEIEKLRAKIVRLA